MGDRNEAPHDPHDWRRKITDIHGAAGAAWLERLPELLVDCEQRWGLTLLPPFPELSYNYVAPAVRADGEPAVLKAGVPGGELFHEIDALRLFAGQGIARLLETDRQWGALLLERLLPGDSLERMDDDDLAARAAAGVMQRLWRPAPVEHSFPTVAGWASGLERLRAHFSDGCGPFPSHLVGRAEGLFRELLEESEPMLIHGDLNPTNILRAGRQPWLAIDPKGVVGDPHFDVATYLNSPPPALQQPGRISSYRDLLSRRVSLFSEILGSDRARILGWGLAHAVLSGWWSYEDHGRGWEGAFAVAELYLDLM
jgi:streptomycin 6-kinase